MFMRLDRLTHSAHISFKRRISGAFILLSKCMTTVRLAFSPLRIRELVNLGMEEERGRSREKRGSRSRSIVDLGFRHRELTKSWFSCQASSTPCRNGRLRDGNLFLVNPSEQENKNEKKEPCTRSSHTLRSMTIHPGGAHL